MENTLAVVVPAGGGGTRLWPRSRRQTPKQFLDIVTPGRTMLQETVDRLLPDLVTPEHAFVITNGSHVGLVREQLPDLPKDNVIGEPQGRDSAPAIGIMAALLEKRLGPDAIMAVLPADHVILNPSAFREALLKAAEIAKDGLLVTLGIPPTSPDTGFGYIRRGEEIGMSSPHVYAVREFKEKPTKDVAEQYLSTGVYFWNAGIYVATVKTYRSLFQKFLPDLEPGFKKLADSVGTPEQEAIFGEVFPTLTKISFDYAIVEKADKVAVVAARVGWNDVGSWARLAEVLAHQSDEQGVIAVGEYRGIDTTDTLIYAPQKLVTTIGLDHLIVIDTPDVLLIASKDRSEEVKKIVEQLQSEGNHQLL